MTVSAADILALRYKHPHVSKLYMSVLKPKVLFCGTVTGTPVRGANTIVVNEVSGSLIGMAAGQTVYVGTACGDYSKSKRRLRGRDDHTLYLDENYVDWQVGDYITVVENWELWSIFPYIDPDDYTFYKDRDVVYSDQNEYPPPVAIIDMTSGTYVGDCLFLDGATVQTSLNSASSYAVAEGATIVSRLWYCEGAVINDDDGISTNIEFDTPGQYWVKLTVTDSNGKSQTQHRPVFVHQRTGEHAPITAFKFSRSLEGSWEAGGWSASVEVFEDASITDIPDSAYVVIWSEMFYDGEERYVNDNNPTLFRGYIIRESIVKNLDTGSVTFDVETINSLLSKLNMTSISLTYDQTPE